MKRTKAVCPLLIGGEGPKPALCLLVLIAILTCGTVSYADGTGERQLEWITLGTSGGPNPNPNRSQPANAAIIDDNILLFDTGDGAVEQLSRVGLGLGQVRAVFLSHLHFDHTAGLLAVLGLRWMTNQTDEFIVYGPPGTRTFVNGLIDSTGPALEVGYGFEDVPARPLNVKAVEITGTKPLEILPGVSVSAVENTHYSFRPGSDMAERYKSLSYRIEAGGRSIVYTGDTGTSEAVTELSQGADLLVSEVLNLPAVLDYISHSSPGMPDRVFMNVKRHLDAHHLSPEEVGEMAVSAGVKKVVLTHMSPGPPHDKAEKLFLPGVTSVFHGPVMVAEDMERY